MDMALWIVFCLFASIGLVQCGYWLSEMFRRPQGLRHGYHLVQLYDEPDSIEMHLRYALTQMRSSDLDREQVILVDMGLGEECRKICEKLTFGMGGVYICEPHEIAGIITDEDNG